MEISTLVSVLDHPHQAADQLHGWKLRDAHRAQQTLIELADCGLTLDLLASLCDQLGRHLPELADPDEVLEALRRFLFASRSPLALGALFDRDRTALPMLLKALSLGERWRDVLINDSEAFDRLRMTEGQPLARETIVSDTCAEVAAVSEERAVVATLRRIKDRESLRIAYGDVFCRHKVELVEEQLTWLTEALIEAALQAAMQTIQTAAPNKGPQPPLGVIGLGRLGSSEADYSGGLELLLVHNPTGPTEAARKASQEQAQRVAKLLVRLLTEVNGVGPIYRVSLAQLPDSASQSLSHTADDTLLGFDNFGRTWHRQAMLKARPVAGDFVLAGEILQRLEPWVYRRYLNRADETGIQALRRRLLKRAASASTGSPGAAVDPVNGRGSPADIEGVVQYLQLLAGGERPSLRTGGTLSAIAALEQSSILSVEERTLLEDNYRWLRRLQHRIQIGGGSEATAMPTDEGDLNALAQTLELAEGQTLVGRCRERMDQVWQAIARLLESSFAEEAPPPVVDLLLDPVPSQAEAEVALSGYGFRDPLAAAAGMQELGREHIPFLGTRRCRHFLSLIAERLLQNVASTPDPDRTLADLVRVSDSLGGKGVLWQLLHVHPPSLQLYVRLCAASPYLAGILTTNPGMIDDLVDSLQLDRLPTREELDRTLAELSRGASDVLPILHDLKNSAHLRIGVRDILGKDAIDATHSALADVAEFCLHHVIERELARLVEKHGQPTLGPGPFEGEACRLVVLGFGKLGAREPNYHSHVEVTFLYEADGTTHPAPRSRQQSTTNNHFFTQLAQRVLKEATQLTPKGRLATVDVVLRPIGVAGAMAMPLADFANHFVSGAAPLWQWQALCQARPVFGEPAMQQSAANVLTQLLGGRRWNETDAQEIHRARLALEHGAAELNLKRAPGGTLDIEFLAQGLQLEHSRTSPAVLVPGTQQTIAALAAAGHLSADDAQYFAESYRFLRRIESALRLLNTSARHDLPEDSLELDKLALLLGQPNGATIRDRVIITLAENRRRFERRLAN